MCEERIDRGERAGTPSELREVHARRRREVKRRSIERDLRKRTTAFWVKACDR